MKEINKIAVIYENFIIQFAHAYKILQYRLNINIFITYFMIFICFESISCMKLKCLQYWID